MYFNSGQKGQFILEDGDFDAIKVEISLWQEENKIDLAIDNVGQYFSLPIEKGEYLNVVDIPSDKGHAQYDGNVVIK